jgi:small subunit ribosomal protein S17
MSDQVTKNIKRHEGLVVSDKMDKTVVVAVERLTPHPLYGRVMRRTRNFKAHDEANDCHQGDRVIIQECRPISKNKCWRVVGVVERAR